MDKIRHISWADVSEDESFDTEVSSPAADSNKQILIDSIMSSTFSSFQFKLENLPYTINKSSEILLFFDMSEEETSVRLQYKGQKFSGNASVTVFNKNAALKIANKYGASLDCRPILILYKPQNSNQWLPQKKKLESLNTFPGSKCDNRQNGFCFNQRPKSFAVFNTPQQYIKQDPAVIKMVKAKRSNTGFCKLLFE